MISYKTNVMRVIRVNPLISHLPKGNIDVIFQLGLEIELNNQYGFYVMYLETILPQVY